MIQRLATFNVALARNAPGQLTADLEAGSPQARAVAAIIQHVRPDVLVLNEFDYDPLALELFRRNYLAAGSQPHDLHYSYTAAVNTGIPSGHDLDGDGRYGGPGDALGFGTFPGQYGMAVLSRHPIDRGAVRRFTRLPWRALPGARMPNSPAGGPWYPDAVASTLPLSSKSHWDIPLTIDGHVLHCLIAHPTPPAFDGDERRNYYRNRDEIRLWQLYLDNRAELQDDSGRRGGLSTEAYVAVMGDLNADPRAGAGDHDVIDALCRHPRLQDPVPRSPGALAWHRGADPGTHPDPGSTTSWLGSFGLRLDYVLPDRRFPVTGCGVFWPDETSRHAGWVGTPGRQAASDHRLVWVDIDMAGPSRDAAARGDG